MATETGTENHEIAPGTVHLIDVNGESKALHAGPVGAHSDVLLHPIPSSDPNDPLNWSRRRKLLCMFCMFSYALCICIGASALLAILQPISEVTSLTIANLNEGTGYMLLAFGWGLLFWQPMALQYGKRPVYLASTLGTIAVMIWTPHTTNNAQWIASKILQGFFGAPAEALCEITITDVWFTHERGTFMALYVLAIEGANCIAPIIGAFIAAGQGWKWVLYWCGIYAGASLIFFFFFFEETNYQRPVVISQTNNSTHQSAKLESNQHIEKVSASSESESKLLKSKLSRLKIIDPASFHRPNSFWNFVSRPLVFLTIPIVAYAGFSVGCYQMWLIVLNGTQSMIFSSPPYNFTTLVVGLPYAGAGVGLLLGTYVAGPIGDKFLIWMARRNNGVMEPEHRLWMLSICALTLPFGNILWGVGAYYDIHWFALVFAMAVITFTTALGVQVAYSYCVDSYWDLSGDSIVTVVLIRNTILFGVNYGITPWVLNLGYKNAYLLAAFLGLAQVLSFLIFIRYGKRLRIASAKRARRYADEVARDGGTH